MHLHHRLAAAAVPALVLSAGGALSAEPPAEPPSIASVEINPSPVHPGSSVVVTVETSPNVVAVDAHVRNMTFHLDPVQSGEFRGTGKVPKIARFFKGTYHVTFVGRCAGGQSVQHAEDVVLN